MLKPRLASNIFTHVSNTLARIAGRRIELLITELQHQAQTEKAGDSSSLLKVKKRKQKRAASDRGILLIAIFKLFKAALLLVVAIGALSLLHKNVADAMMNLLDALHVDHDNNFIHGLVMKLGLFNDRKLAAISAGSFFYTALLTTEGVGLLLKKHWAEYLTIIATALFIPLELYEIVKRLSVGKIIVLIINIAMVVYLIYRVQYDRKHMQIHQARSNIRG